MKIDFAFVVLTYRNADDLPDFLQSVSAAFEAYSKEVLIVNSFYDEESETTIRRFAEANGCLFLSTENKGYGHGNNVGIEYFRAKYDYRYLVIANPDTKVLYNRFDFASVDREPCVIAPRIRTLTGKEQNPYWVIKNPLSERLVYRYFTKGGRLRFYAGIGINKILRILFNLKRQRKKKAVFAAHGSFLVFSRSAMDQIGLPYDEKMFLFAEENLLAHTLRGLKIPIYFTSEIEILHKEDGSVSISDVDENLELKKSTIYYYEKLRKK